MNLNELNKEQLNNFVSQQKQSQFLQSFEWGEFQEKMGNKVFRLGVEEDGKIVGAWQLVKKALPLGRGYLYGGRIFLGNRQQATGIIDKIKELAREEKAIFLRLEPLSPISNFKFQISKTLDVQPSKTLILNLSKSEEDLLKEMHQKTRYNIKLAAKKGVAIREAGDDEFDKLWALMEETKTRDEFRLHERGYYEEMIKISQKLKASPPESLRSSERAGSQKFLDMKLYFAEYEDRVIAANIVSFFGDMVTYVHGASSDKDRNVMAPYLLQWEVIKQAKKDGFSYYDFHGIDEVKWPGVTRFKRGFGGEEVNYPGAFDVIFNKRWYSIYKIIRAVRRFI